MTTASTVTRWRDEYARKYHVHPEVLRSFGDDIAHAMNGLCAKGMTCAAAYKVIINGLYAEDRAVPGSIAANRRRKRASRKRTSRKRR